MSHSATANRMLDSRGYSGPLIRGSNPLTLLDPTLRDRIIESYYWKESCFGLSCSTILDRAVQLTCIGGTYGGGASQKPTPFLCLVLKLLQLMPEQDILDEYLTNGGDEFKYLRALALVYVRLTSEDSKTVYEVLERYLDDKRKLRRRTREGYRLTYIDEFVDDLLTKERVCGISLWKLPARQTLEDADVLEARTSPLGEEVDDLFNSDEEDQAREDVNGHDNDD